LTYWSRQDIARVKARKVVHPAAPGNFFLFGSLKREMAGFRASSPEGVPSKIRWIFEDTQRRVSSLPSTTGSQGLDPTTGTREIQQLFRRLRKQ
jgi:hypothetical protein